MPIDPPINFSVETVVGCNLHCLICATGCGKLTRPTTRLMSLEAYQQIFEKIRPHARMVTLFNWGEPMLNPAIYDMIELTQEHAQPVIHTNANCSIDVERLGASRTIVSVSLDGLSQASYEIYRRGGRIRQALTTLLMLHARRQRPGKWIWKDALYAQFLLFKHNQHELFNFLRLMSALEIPVRVKIPETVLNPVLAPTDLPRFNPRPPATPEIIRACPLVRTDMFILNDGTAVPCCYDYNADLPLGNIFETSVEEIWNSERYQTLRAAIASEKTPDFCASHCLNYEPNTVIITGIEDLGNGVEDFQVIEPTEPDGL